MKEDENISQINSLTLHLKIQKMKSKLTQRQGKEIIKIRVGIQKNKNRKQQTEYNKR